MDPLAGRKGLEVVVVHGGPTAEEVAALVVSLGMLVRRASSARRPKRSHAWLLRPGMGDRWRRSAGVGAAFSRTTAAWGG